MTRWLVAVLFFWAVPAGAQDVVFSMQATDACLDAGGSVLWCAGRSASRCTEATPGGSSTVAMGACAEREWTAWDGRLNQAYAEAMAYAKRADADSTFGPRLGEALREMQRAWIPYRDRACDYERAQWGGGTGGGPASLMCLARETARQTFVLRERLGQ